MHEGLQEERGGEETKQARRQALFAEGTEGVRREAKAGVRLCRQDMIFESLCPSVFMSANSLGPPRLLARRHGEIGRARQALRWPGLILCLRGPPPRAEEYISSAAVDDCVVVCTLV